MYSYPQKKERNGKYTEEERKGKVERSGIGAVRCSQNDTDEIGKKRMKEEEYERMTWRKDRETGETEKGKRKKQIVEEEEEKN